MSTHVPQSQIETLKSWREQKRLVIGHLLATNRIVLRKGINPHTSAEEQYKARAKQVKELSAEIRELDKLIATRAEKA